MNVFVALVVVVAAAALAIGAILLVRRRAPEGSYFNDGDRAAGVFGVLATGFAVLLGLVVVLAFTSYDDVAHRRRDRGADGRPAVRGGASAAARARAPACRQS